MLSLGGVHVPFDRALSPKELSQVQMKRVRDSTAWSVF